MDNDKFINLCKRFVVDYVNQSDYETCYGYRPYIKKWHVFVVWLCKTLQNNKALLSTTVDGDPRYYEITYNGDKNEFYFDAYDKIKNVCIPEDAWKGDEDIKW